MGLEKAYICLFYVGFMLSNYYGSKNSSMLDIISLNLVVSPLDIHVVFPGKEDLGSLPKSKSLHCYFSIYTRRMAHEYGQSCSPSGFIV